MAGLRGDRSRAMECVNPAQPLVSGRILGAVVALALLWGEDISAHQFNDDALGRVLEDLADSGRTLLATLGPRMQAVQGTGPMMSHSDTPPLLSLGIIPTLTRGRRPRWSSHGVTVKTIVPICAKLWPD